MYHIQTIEKSKRTALLIKQLVEVWEGSVAATHDFLSLAERNSIKQYVPQALQEIPLLFTVENDEQRPVGFMGIDRHQLEMLFIADSERGHGLGKQLLQLATEKYDVNQVAVNEQNPRACGFYQHMGFEVYKRTELDEQGNPYPLLYMKLKTTR